ncbi:FxsA family protein [Saccharopolyspora sp. MS10]|uniref:FxsA family protein n=1 Tax=Saccharopolyspora sp. MS10 TaxID=3385973 RepID=UPI0039A12E4A
MPVLLLLLVAAVVEISVLVLVGNAIGVLPTIGLLVLSAVVGGFLLRREGRRAFEAFNESVTLRRPPERELADGALVVAGGVLIVLPGLVSDVLGVLCLLPPTRALLRRYVQRLAERNAERARQRVAAGMRTGWVGAQGSAGPGPASSPYRDGDVIDGEVVSVSEDDLPREHPPLDASPQAERPGGGAAR